MAAKRAVWPLLFILLIAGSVYVQQNRLSFTIRSTAVDLLAPLHAVIAQFSEASQGILEAVNTSRSVQQDTDRLQRLVEELRRENVELWEIVAMQQQAIQQNEFQHANPQWTYLSARVIAWDPSNIVRTVVINKGYLDGVRDGMVVTSSRGLVGRVLELSDRWSEILLITDPRSSVNGMLQGANDRPKGILQGRPDELLHMKYLLAEASVNKGEVIVTSGMGGRFPPGLFIGWIVEAGYSEGQMFHEALVRPAATFSDLTDVMVVTNFIPLNLD